MIDIANTIGNIFGYLFGGGGDAASDMASAIAKGGPGSDCLHDGQQAGRSVCGGIPEHLQLGGPTAARRFSASLRSPTEMRMPDESDELGVSVFLTIGSALLTFFIIYGFCRESVICIQISHGRRWSGSLSGHFLPMACFSNPVRLQPRSLTWSSSLATSILETARQSTPRIPRIFQSPLFGGMIGPSSVLF